MKGLATVARPVKSHEVKSSPGAQAAMDKEWASLRELKAWDEKNVREWSDVRNEARNNKERNHVGMIFGFYVEKGSELPKGHSQRKFKGRVLFRGNQVRDEGHYLATFW